MAYTSSKNVQQLAQLARDNADEEAFHTQLHTDGRWDGDVRTRYAQVKALVSHALTSQPTGDEARVLTWQLLQRLWIVQLRVEAADEADWAQLANSLNRVARAGHTGASCAIDCSPIAANSTRSGRLSTCAWSAGKFTRC
jgi:hypothetical protein